MKYLYLVPLALLFSLFSHSQLQITATDTEFTIDFDSTVSDVSNGAFDASGFTPTPATGQLDSDAWAIAGFSDGSLAFGGSNITGDFARGTSTGGKTTGGIYAFETSTGNYSFGIQPGGSDFTPGTITLKTQNQTGSTVTSVNIEYLLNAFNNEERSNSLNLSYSTDDIAYTAVPSMDFTTIQGESTNPTWESSLRGITITGLSIADGQDFYIRWTGNDNGGSGSRDEYSIDDISVSFEPSVFNFGYDGTTWTPSDPSSTGTARALIVQSGAPVVSASITCDNLILEAGAGLDLTSGTVTVNTLAEFESSSNSYSSIRFNGGTISATNAIYNRYTNIGGAGVTGGNDLISPPVTVSDFGDFVIANPNLVSSGSVIAFATFNKDMDSYDNLDSTTNGDDALGSTVGYRSATVDGSTVSFEGSLVTADSDATISVGTGTFGKWNLIGNPLPSFLRIGSFFASNDASNFDVNNVAIYGYDADDSDGSVWTIWDLNTDPNSTIAPGQGFFVASNTGGGRTISFNLADTRTGVADDDFIAGRTNTTNYAHTMLLLLDTDVSYETNIYFRDINTRGLDPGYDTGAIFNSADGIFTHLVENNQGVELYNQSLPFSDLSDIVVSLGVKSPALEERTIRLDPSYTLPSGINVYLEDNVENEWTLLNTSDYVFTPNTELVGVGRFYIHFSSQVLSNPEADLSTIQLFVDNNLKQLQINGSLSKNTNISIYDLQGRSVTHNILNTASSYNTVDVSQFTSGLYVVEIVDGNKRISQKVIIR
ncbi:T9SS type A sorting domain-containing protein [Winogradskyella poriferorum]|uniref:T9SS type A sorting domain-containing protein n=1 Tax=Winogradskyella poriferorum TaxID=307627 RepID=UPI003D646112